MNQNEYLTLHGPSTTIVLELCPDGPPLWRYWGAFNEALPPSRLREERPTPSFSLDETIAFSVLPTFGFGWFGQSGLLAHRGGVDFAHHFGAAQVEWIDPGKAVRLTLTDDVTEIEVCVMLTMAGDVLTLSSAITNRGEGLIDLQWLAAAALPLPAHARNVQSYSGRHNAEFAHQTDTLGRALWRKENRHGLTSHDAFPGAIVDADDVTYGAQLAWSGNHVQSIEWIDDGRYQWQMGEWLAPGEVRLATNETYQSPDVLAACSAQGAGGVAHHFHDHIRTIVDWPAGSAGARPVHLNTWEGYYFDHDLLALITLADVAADVGIERFVLDDGWFHRRDDDSRGLGDWWADMRKYPDGLSPLAAHVVAKDMQFGLWVEPEMVNPDSNLFTAHPEWALQIAGRTHQTARNQLVLDLSRPAVCDYLFDHISTLLRDLPISYLKWDHNRDLVAAGGRDGHSAYHRQIGAAYALFARFRAAFPHVEIEACAGGGGRIDAGIVRHTHRFWTSDCIDAVSRVDIQRGFLQFMPPELMGAHIGTAPAHSTGRSQSLDFRAAVALQGHLGIEFDLVTLGPDERARVAQWIGFYKEWRHILHTTVWNGEAPDHVVWHGAGSAREWILIVYQMKPMQQRHTSTVRLPFVDRNAAYEVRRIGPGIAPDGVTVAGDWLALSGLTILPMMAEHAVIYHGQRI